MSSWTSVPSGRSSGYQSCSAPIGNARAQSTELLECRFWSGVRFCDAAFVVRHARRIERDVCERVGVGIVFATDVLDGEVGNLLGEFGGALEKRLQIGAFHFVAALHLPHQKLGIAADA